MTVPMEVLISVLYWGLRAVRSACPIAAPSDPYANMAHDIQIDPALVMPEWAPPLDFNADLSFHAVPTLVLLIDLLLLSPPYAISALPSLALSSGIAVAYWFWVEACYTRNGFYPYPIFEQVGYGGRVGLFAASALVMACSAASLRWLYAVVNGREVEEDVVEGGRGGKAGDVNRQ